ncbi:glutamine synthetase [Rhodovulum sulfidophilum]|uniref:glutamine synthetase n=1 Tax=Rhodovulum sulfidophilum TaxID=35806 RepID=UPI00138A2175|nr:glutamine synthetase [Rhodovulum sulfidophilum]
MPPRLGARAAAMTGCGPLSAPRASRSGSRRARPGGKHRVVSAAPVHPPRRKDGRHAVFEPGAPPAISAPRRQYLAGPIARAADLTVFAAPCANSDRRFGKGRAAPGMTVRSVSPAPPAPGHAARTRPRPGPDAGSPGRTSPPVWRRSGVLPQA